jgi:cysteinyl-tRNA synthetase
MALKLFNTLSRSVQEFAPLDSTGKKVGLYCCGPTIHDFTHIGNWRICVFADLALTRLPLPPCRCGGHLRSGKVMLVMLD